jgi:hypothetical protein
VPSDIVAVATNCTTVPAGNALGTPLIASEWTVSVVAVVAVVTVVVAVVAGVVGEFDVPHPIARPTTIIESLRISPPDTIGL